MKLTDDRMHGTSWSGLRVGVASTATGVRLSSMGRHSTHAGGRNGYVGPCYRGVKLSLNRDELLIFAAPLQALGQTMKRPDIVRMLRAALDPAAQTQIVAVDLFGLLELSLFG